MGTTPKSGEASENRAGVKKRKSERLLPFFLSLNLEQARISEVLTSGKEMSARTDTSVHSG